MHSGSDISPLLSGRKNNFDLLRFFAASLVLVSHAFPLSYGNNNLEPLYVFSHAQYTLGGLAVAVFFIISGFLITASYEGSASNIEFLIKRSLRIFPGLAVVVILSVFVLGPIYTDFYIADYFRDAGTYTYLKAVLLFSDQYDLPGVFANNPFPLTVNGSLWTLWYEFVCYLLVLFLGMTNLLRWPVLLGVLLVTLGASINWSNVPLMWRITPYLSGIDQHFVTFTAYFAAGSLIYLCRSKIAISAKFAAVSIFAIVIAANTGHMGQVVTVFGAYLVIYLAFATWLPAHNFAKWGDFSYGIYIYAFPVQQAIAALSENNPQWTVNAMGSFPVVLILAVASWHWIEKPAMLMKKKIMRLVSVDIKTAQQ